MKGKSLVILVAIPVIGFVLMVWASSGPELSKASTGTPAAQPPPINYPPFEVPKSFWPPERIDPPGELDCNVGDFTQDKSTDPDWNQCPMRI